MKQWTEQDTTSNVGIAKLYRVVTDMGYIWRPTPNSDVGLDGEIELVEDRAATAKIMKVQVKSGASYFRKEDQRSFEYQASKEDLEYWLKANNRVLLVLYHPQRDLLYGIHVQGHAEVYPEVVQTRVIRFDKVETLMLPEHGDRLKRIVFKGYAQTRLPISIKRREKLFSNLLPLVENIEFLYSLPTPCLDKHEVRIALGKLPKPPFILRENRLWTCSYLPSEDCALRVACDTSAEVKLVPAREWLRIRLDSFGWLN
jgi:hypothetical protein